MYKLSIFIIMLIASSFAYGESLLDVSFKNNSDALLKCEEQEAEGYVTFLRLIPNTEKGFKGFQEARNIRCYTRISNNAVTPFTYFNVEQSGEYELLKEKVSCSKCANGVKLRWATIVVYPNGNAFYSKW